MSKQDEHWVSHFHRLWKSAIRALPQCKTAWIVLVSINGSIVHKLFSSFLNLLVFLITPVFCGKMINETCKNIYSMLLRVALNRMTWVIVVFWETVDNHFLFIFSTLIEMHEISILHLYCQVSTLKSPFLFSLYF